MEIANLVLEYLKVLLNWPLLVLVLAWLYADTRDPRQVADLSMGIFWFVLGSLPFFLALAFGLRNGWRVELAFAVAIVVGFAGVSLVQWLLSRTPA